MFMISSFKSMSGNVCNFEQKEQGGNVALSCCWTWKPTEADKDDFTSFITERLSNEGVGTVILKGVSGSVKRTPESLREQAEDIERFLKTGEV